MGRGRCLPALLPRVLMQEIKAVKSPVPYLHRILPQTKAVYSPGWRVK